MGVQRGQMEDGFIPQQIRGHTWLWAPLLPAMGISTGLSLLVSLTLLLPSQPHPPPFSVLFSGVKTNPFRLRQGSLAIFVPMLALRSPTP